MRPWHFNASAEFSKNVQKIPSQVQAHPNHVIRLRDLNMYQNKLLWDDFE